MCLLRSGRTPGLFCRSPTQLPTGARRCSSATMRAPASAAASVAITNEAGTQSAAERALIGYPLPNNTYPPP